MTNKRRTPVQYRKFEARPLLAEGLLPVAREGGDLERRVAAGMSRLAGKFSAIADREAILDGGRRGEADALAGRPMSIDGSAGATASDRPSRAQVQAPGAIRQMISAAAQRHGIDPAALLKIAELESSFNPAAKNPATSAGGLFQFIDGTAAQYGLADRFDPAQASDAAARFARDNAATLRKALGREPTAGELYLAHQQGAGGATKLLANPGRRAADLVGAEAIALNGGRSDMTAREFANLWISKAGGATSIAAGRSAAWQPTGSATLRGRAYDQAGSRTYLQMLDTAMRDDISSVYETYKDDPAKLETALGQLKAAHLNEHVFEEIAADYTVAFDRQANSAVGRAKAEAAQRAEEADRAAFNDRLGIAEEDKSRLMAGLDVTEDGALEQLLSAQATIDDHYDSAAERGIMSADAARQAKERSRRDTMTGFYVSQGMKLPADDIAALRDQIRSDYAAGDLPGVDRHAFADIDAKLAKLERDRRTKDKQISKRLRREGDDLAKRHAVGETTGADELAAFQFELAQAPDGSEIGRSALRRLQVAEAIRTMPLSDAERALPELVRDESGRANPTDLAFGRDLIDRHKKELATDPLGVAERFGAIDPVEPLPFDAPTPADAAAAFEKRLDAAETAAERFGVPALYFRAGEAKLLRGLIDNDPEAAMALAAGMVSAGGDALPSMLRELGKDAEPLSHAGAIIAAGGDPEAARLVLEGTRPGQDGRMRPQVPRDRQREVSSEVIGTAFSLHPAEGARIRAAAGSIARARLDAAGIDPKSDDARPVYERALNEAAGATYIGDVQYGGFADHDPGLWWSSRKVLVPTGIRADAFGQVLDAVTETDLRALPVPPVDAEGRPYPAAQIKGAFPVATAGGYRFATGDPESDTPMWVRGADGRPFVLSFEAIPALRDRLPAGVWRP
ncbi:transglycosylase SLT domain-containing protein [Stappia taiwanensis]|uniref:Transglycosylase SLT domain-containing protein n=1 Tax=Stappia taiwanensis TaxID=992267 RepID=A0A838XVT7_9HYPH|nr:transglycosylase SLT domain-containing protein [Stappia taiwanensis]MBA4613847.1 transglycosylase SLT domain-containing protein [Stappia taiwanensis]GGE79051.1 hypothetical protein GCM10007285_03610 [Stappia taiwanensis]